MFVTLPLAFARMPLGAPAAIAFFVLLTLAALASALSLLEMPVSLAHRWLGWSRPSATLAAAVGCWALGLATWYPLAKIPGLATATAFESLDYVSSNVLLPLGGLGLAIFGGWIVQPDALARELGLGPGALRGLTLVLRYVAPIGILAASVAPFVLR